MLLLTPVYLSDVVAEMDNMFRQVFGIKLLVMAKTLKYRFVMQLLLLTPSLAYSGTCGNFVCEDNNDDDGSCSSNTLASTVSFPTQNGVTYYILVHRFRNTAGGTFDISVTCTTCTPSASNDNCGTAAPLTSGVLLAANNTCAGGAPANPSCNSFQSAFDVWYTINSGISTSLTIDLAAVTASGLRYAVYTGSCGSLTSVYCSTTPPASNTLTLSGTPTNYYIQVWSTSVSTRGDFNITATLSGGACMAANAGLTGSNPCAGQNFSLNSNVTFGTGPYTYQWSGTGTFSPSSTAQNPTVSGGATGTYTVTITDNGNSPCNITKTVSVTVNPLPDALASSNAPVCAGFPLSLFGTNNDGSQINTGWSWSGPSFTSTSQNPNISNASAANSGTYTLTITNSFGCTATSSTDVIVNPNPVLSIGTQTNVSCNGLSDGSVDLDATNGTSPISL